jgi:3-deoxy-D-manno-octulosonic-acid transferase
MRQFDVITTQSEADRKRLIELGAAPDSIHTIGDIKFDREVLEPAPETRAAKRREAGWPDGRWIVAGSTHSGEESIFLKTFIQLKEQYHDLKLLIAPRNKSDFETVWTLITEKGLPAAHRGQPQAADMNKDIFLLDTLGELDSFYDIADIALVGKSWPGQHKGGGHNPLEAAAKGKPVLFGPLTHNYRWMTRALVAAGGGLMAQDQPALLAALDDLLANPEKTREMGRKAADFVRQHQGATAKTMDYLRPFIERAK